MSVTLQINLVFQGPVARDALESFGIDKGSMHVVENRNVYFPVRKYVQITGACIKDMRCIINLGKGILFHTVGAQWYTQQFNVMLSLCQMPDSAATHPKCKELSKHKFPPWLPSLN
jgi:hypothetical protein